VLVVRVGGKSGVVDCGDLRVAGQEAGQRPGVVVLGADPKVSRIDTIQSSTQFVTAWLVSPIWIERWPRGS
jgi:hypothetical protein